MQLPLQGQVAPSLPGLASCRLFPLATVITPNLSEASALLDGRDISDISSMKAAARDLHAFGPQYVLVKGGHLQQGTVLAPAWSSISVTDRLQASSASKRVLVFRDLLRPCGLIFLMDCHAGALAEDVLYDGQTAHVLSGPRIDTLNTHGTGCTTASAIAAGRVLLLWLNMKVVTVLATYLHSHPLVSSPVHWEGCQGRSVDLSIVT